MLNKKIVPVLLTGCAIIGVALPTFAQSYTEMPASFKMGGHYAEATQPITLDIEKAKMDASESSNNTSVEAGEVLAAPTQNITMNLHELKMKAMGASHDYIIEAGDVFAETYSTQQVVYHNPY